MDDEEERMLLLVGLGFGLVSLIYDITTSVGYFMQKSPWYKNKVGTIWPIAGNIKGFVP